MKQNTTAEDVALGLIISLVSIYVILTIGEWLFVAS
jgi:hypothetical protein